MNNRREFDLLVELAKLLRKFGPETFDSLARTVSDDQMSQKLAEILSRTAKAGHVAGSGLCVKERTPNDFRSHLLAIPEIEPHKLSLLVEIYDGLIDKTLLPSSQQLREFADYAGLSLPKKVARNRLAVSLVKHISPLSLHEIQENLSAMRSASARSDRSLAGWSSVILDKAYRTREPG